MQGRVPLAEADDLRGGGQGVVEGVEGRGLPAVGGVDKGAPLPRVAPEPDGGAAGLCSRVGCRRVNVMKCCVGWLVGLYVYDMHAT